MIKTKADLHAGRVRVIWRRLLGNAIYVRDPAVGTRVLVATSEGGCRAVAAALIEVADQLKAERVTK